ncbi:bifunctional phosphopantothenoylcysteine decarboxylase/phosphopantothenate--cysteine ligase CoaBC [Sinobaca sp. H24]|uniref:bifunctional phosphopantothenoylcysteine decarboxylase/phosphopantothenate--cysteine ligase CoaBC n=1 Tax=Sinobaca sp. H24 TaxID=2923376 RepID=UPI0020795EB6|nr:bifunctional phosphopantothenoylcysteine decarboxylase/phosphopantothenate--cysteine ligase CoaBC [Sinobaca sp. H24]
MQGKNIVLAVSGGIAAFKAAALASRLKQSGAHVKVMMTDHAQEFVTPLTFQALTRERVYTDTFAEKEPEVVAHIDIADWADIFIIAPATSNILGKLANGIADDMVTTTALATKASMYAVPAMNVNMYNHPAVQRSMNQLKQDGYRFVEPGEGYLACGWIGKGRMAEPEDIIGFLSHQEKAKKALAGRRVLVTAGPTHEYIDPVRVLTNPSSGKMGFAFAGAAADMGAEVTLVAGPVKLDTPPGVKRVDVISAADMHHEVMAAAGSQDIIVKAAAVSDYRAKERLAHKEKKTDGTHQIEMERTTDILQELGMLAEKPFLIGFAAESENVESYAQEKLQRKNADMIVANNIASEGTGFNTDTNEVFIVQKEKPLFHIPLQSKQAIAETILAMAVDQLEDADKK